MQDLEKVKVAVFTDLQDYAITDDARFDVSLHTSFIKDVIMTRVILKVWSEEAGTYTHPKDWWQMLKEAVFPKWLKVAFPVKYKTVAFACLYPKWKPSMDEPHNIIVKDIDG